MEETTAADQPDGIVPDYPRGITFEQVWAAIYELRESQKETERLLRENAEAVRKAAEETRQAAEEARRVAEAAREADRKAAEEAKKAAEEAKKAEEAAREADKKAAEAERIKSEKEFKASEKKLQKMYGELGIRLGGLIEDMIEPNLVKKLSKLGFQYSQLTRNRVLTFQGLRYIEVDILVESDEKVLVVEVKSKAHVNDVKEHVKRMMKMRIYADSKNDKRKYFGAIGSMAFEEDAKRHIFGCGFYLIEPAGTGFTITAPKGIYSPREW